LPAETILQMEREGMTPDEIAIARNVSEFAISRHLENHRCSAPEKICADSCLPSGWLSLGRPNWQQPCGAALNGAEKKSAAPAVADRSGAQMGRPSNFSRMIVERAMGAAQVEVTRHDRLTKVDVSPPAPPTPGAVRMRRHRSLKRQGAVAVDCVVGADAVQSLIELGWLDPEHRGDRGAVAGAIVALATRALALRIRPQLAR
jgi:hypothetical protein